MPKPLPPDVDDRSILDQELLYIRVIADKDSIIFDQEMKRFRPTSSALKSRDEPLSVDLSSVSTPQETKDRATIAGYFHVAAFTARTARKYKCRVVRDPDEATPPPPQIQPMLLSSVTMRVRAVVLKIVHKLAG